MADGHGGERWKKLRSMIEANMMEIKLRPKTGIEYQDVGCDMIFNELNKLVLAMDIMEKDICDECGGPALIEGTNTKCRCWDDT